MNDPEKIYRITIRHDFALPANWPNLLSSAPQITLLSTTGRHARIEATSQAIDNLQKTLGRAAIIEEETPRFF